MNGKIKPEEIVSYTYTALEAAGFESLQDALKELKAQRDCVTMLKAEVNRLYKLIEANREVAHRLATTKDRAERAEDQNERMRTWFAKRTGISAEETLRSHMQEIDNALAGRDRLAEVVEAIQLRLAHVVTDSRENEYRTTALQDIADILNEAAVVASTDREDPTRRLSREEAINLARKSRKRIDDAMAREVERDIPADNED